MTTHSPVPDFVASTSSQARRRSTRSVDLSVQATAAPWACVEHPMVAVADQRTGEVHSQVYSAVVVAPRGGFEYWMTAMFAPGTGTPQLRTPAHSNTTAVVL